MAKLQQDLCYSIRLMEDRDIAQAMEIDREAFATQWPHPTYSSFKQELRNHLARYVVAYKQNELISQPVTESGDNKTFWDKLKHFLNQDQMANMPVPLSSTECIIGMAAFWIMVGEAHITTIAVRDAYRRQGIGERLLISLIDLALQLNAHIVTLEVRASNELAQSLYEKYGFFKAGVRHRYYSDNGEDAFIMTTDTTTCTSFQSCFRELKKAYEQRWGLLSDL